MKKERLFTSLVCAFIILLTGVQNIPAQDSNPLKVALLFDIGGRGDSGFNDSAYKGLEKAVSGLGVKAVYIEQKRNLEREHAANEAAASDAGIIIGVGFAFSEKLSALAEKYPSKKFICIDYTIKYNDKGEPEPLPFNMAGITFREEEGSYLVGAVAALTSKTGSIGFMGGMDSPIIRRFQGGYLAGARAVRPDIRVISKYAGITGKAFNDPAKGYQIATQMYEEGADIIYHASGATGNGLFRAAKKMNRLAIGVDTDQSSQAPGLVLTSMLKNIDIAVFESVKSCVEGSFKGGLKSLGLKEQGVGFVYDKSNRKLIPEEIHNRVLSLQSQIIKGELKVPETSDHRLLLSEEELQTLLSGVKSEIDTALKKLNGDLKKYAQELADKDLKSDAARNMLKKLYKDNPYIIDCETVNNQGIMVAIEPSKHRSSEGVDISKQAHMIKLYKTHRPVMSASFPSVEGPQAVVIHHPVFSLNGRFKGSVSALFAPEYLLSGIIGPVSSNLPVDIFLMQTDGLIIYDVDETQIGLNVITDPLYQPFPELTSLVRNMAVASKGSGVYSFYLKGGNVPVTKNVYWQSVDLYDVAWRLAIACAKENMGD